MKILAISDVISELVHSPNIVKRFSDVDFVLCCGDLPFDYMEYVVTMLGKALYYVYGNHTQPFVLAANGDIRCEPQGCINIHRKVICHCGLLIAGLEGSIRYRPDGEHQYTQLQMRRMAHMMAPQLWWNRRRYGRPVDILITHAPPYGIHDGKDLPHQGFVAYLNFMDRYKPRYLIHGHTHLYRLDARRETRYGETTVLNAFGYQVIEIDETELDPRTQRNAESAGHA